MSEEDRGEGKLGEARGAGGESKEAAGMALHGRAPSAAAEATAPVVKHAAAQRQGHAGSAVPVTGAEAASEGTMPPPPPVAEFDPTLPPWMS